MRRAGGKGRNRAEGADAGVGFGGGGGGFTLLEVLLATALTVIVMGAVYATFSLVERAAGGGQQPLRRLYEAQKTMDTLRRELEASTGPMTVVNKEYFGKKGSTLTFTAFSPLNGVLSNIVYSVRESAKAGSIDLEKEQQAYYGGELEKADLMDNIGAFSVQTFSDGKWAGTFEGDQPPQEIRVVLKIYFKDRPFVLREIITPRIHSRL